jgi:hypothetical protein
VKLPWSEDKASELVTLYKGEEEINPAIAKVWDWADDKVFNLLEATARDQTILAGGALRSYFTNTPVRDFDLYPYDSRASALLDRSTMWQPWFKIPSKSNSSTVVRYVGQDINSGEFINREFNIIKQVDRSCEEILATFDFTVVMCAVTRDRLVYHRDFFVDLQARQLRIQNLENPFNTLWRIQKYAKYGFDASQEEMWKLIQAIHESELPKLESDTEKNQSPGIRLSLSQIFSQS